MIKQTLQYYWYCYLHPSVIRNWVLGKYYELLGPMFRTAQQLADARMKGDCLTAYEREVIKRQTRCNHRKGGTINLQGSGNEIAKGLYNGHGPQYSVFKHQHINGDIWVECLRCGKKWKPPLRADYRKDRDFYRALEEYERAVDFDTNNVTSTSVQCAFRLNGSLDAGHEYYRKLVAAS